MNYMEAAFAPVEAVYRGQVLAATFGHLAPRKNKRYYGTILFAIGEYGDIVVLRSQLDGLDGSPWYFDAEQDFVGRQAEKMERGDIARFTGYFCNYRFVGECSAVEMPGGAS